MRAATGNINPNNLEIDLGPNGANLYLDNLSTANLVDWVKNPPDQTNTDPPSLVDGVAVGIDPGTTGKVGGTGYWNGVRLVDGIANLDQDIFLTGGKENDVSTWNVGPGSVGSAKYDITQAYLANNQQYLYFGMERRGNNGTTAFDFEFNQLPPLTPYLPNRSVGDVLFTFEMSGSGQSGSAVPYFFVWDGTQYSVPKTKPGLESSINEIAIPAAPWGRVDSKGNWVGTDLDRFEFAEASVLLQEAFPGFSPCGTTAYVQVRTRSSATPTSDLKDTTKIFTYKFGGPTATMAPAVPDCLSQFSYDGTGSVDSGGGQNLTYSWSFYPPAGVTLSGTGITGPDGTGAYHSTLVKGTVLVGLPGSDPVTIGMDLVVTESALCTDQAPGPGEVTVYPVLTSAITRKDYNGTDLSVTLTGSAPTATSLQWQRDTGSGWADITGATSGTLVYSSFETDATPVAKTLQVSMDGGITTQNYAGKLWSVSVRLHAERLVDGLLCTANSDPITLKKVAGVDP